MAQQSPLMLAMLLPFVSLLATGVEFRHHGLAWAAVATLGLLVMWLLGHVSARMAHIEGWLALAYLPVVGVIRDATGGANSEYNVMVLVPLVLVLLHGTKWQRRAMLVGIGLLFLVPVVLIGGSEYPIAQGARRAVAVLCVVGLISVAVQLLLAAVRDRERTLTALFERLPGTVVVLFDGDLRFHSVSGSGLGTEGGVSWQDVVGRTPDELFSPERAAIMAGHMRAAASGAESTFEWASIDSAATHLVSIGPCEASSVDDVVGIVTVRDITALKAAQREVKELATIVQCSGDAIFSVDMDGRIRTWNNSATALFGYTTEEAFGRHVSFLTPSDEQLVRERDDALAMLRDGGSVPPVNTQRLHRDGHAIDVRLTRSAIVIDGEVVGMSATMTDITAQVEAERARAEARALLDGVLANATAIVFAKDLEGRYRFVNPAFERIVGLSADQVIGRSDAELFPGTDDVEWRTIQPNVFRDEVTHDTSTQVDVDGVQREFATVQFLLHDATGAVHAVASMSTDVTDLALARKSLEEERSFLRAVIDTIHDGVFAVDADGNPTVVNAAMRRVIGDSVVDEERIEELRSSTYWMDGENAVPLEPSDSPIVRALRGERTNDRLMWMPDVGGGERFSEVNAAPMLGADGTLLGAVTITHDVTAQRQAERMKEQFFALVSHELRTPLASIVGYLELLEDEEIDRLSEDGREHVAIMRRNSTRLMRLIGDLLFAAQINIGDLTLNRSTIDLVAALRDSLRSALPLAAERDQSLTLDVDEDVALLVDVDPHRIGQVIDNLVANAVKFTPPSGSIRVAARVERDPDDDRSWVRVEVEDDGPGIAPEDHQKIFGRFARTDDAEAAAVEGVGLGLSICRSIVLAHGGSIGVDSQLGEGARFHVLLPLVSDPASAATHPRAWTRA